MAYLKKLIVIFGATGAQGGSVVRYMKNDDSYKLRIVTRNIESERAKALASEGLEVVQADLCDPDSLKKALDGAYGAFLVTNYLELFDKAKEVQQGKNAINAAKDCQIQHLIFSGLENVKEAIDKDCPHFDGKAELEKYIEEQKIPFTFVRYAFYCENLIGMMKPRKKDDGTFVYDIPMGDVAMAVVPVTETGECIHQIFSHPSEYIGTKIGLSSSKLKISEYAAILSKASGKKVTAGPISVEQYANLGFPGAIEFSAMFDFLQRGQVDRDIDVTRKLNPSISSFQQWVDKNHDAIVDALK